MPKVQRLTSDKTPLDVFASYVSASDHPSVKLAPMDVRVYYFLLSATYAEKSDVFSEFRPGDVMEYFQMSSDQIRTVITLLKKQGWLREVNGRYVVGRYLQGGIFSPLLDKPESDNISPPHKKYDWEWLEPLFKQLRDYCEGYGERSHPYISMYRQISSEIKTLLDREKKLTLALSASLFQNVYYVAYGTPCRDFSRDEGFVFTNLFRRYKSDTALVAGIIMDFVMNFHQYRRQGVPTPKVLSFMADDVHAKITGLTDGKKENEKKTQRASRRNKPKGEF